MTDLVEVQGVDAAHASRKPSKPVATLIGTVADLTGVTVDPLRRDRLPRFSSSPTPSAASESLRRTR